MPGKPIKARHAENQHLVELLFAKRQAIPPAQPGHRSHFAQNLKTAEEGVRKMAQPVKTYKEALAVKGIGPKIAHILFPHSARDEDGDEKDSSRATTKRKATTASPVSSVSGSKRKRQDKSMEEHGEKSSSAKVRAYEKAVADSTKWKAQSRDLVWKVVLILDEREREKVQMESKCLMAKIPCERRTLPIGDMAWLAKGFHKDDKNEKPVVELMLGTIIERKSLSDLVQSIMGSRYIEQRMRMKESGLPQLLFLVEGDLQKDSRNSKEFKMCYTAMYETRLHLGFQIVQTANMTETIQTLKRLHRRILKRTFPLAFYAEALPVFSGPELNHRQQPQQSPRNSIEQQLVASNVRRRRKNESLQEMRFDVEPQPFGDMERFITYAEFKAKVEMGRENANRSIAMVHAAMLKQVSRVENKKVKAILNMYPTPQSLFTAYDEMSSEKEKKELVSSMSLTDESHATQRTVGPQSSLNLYAAYGMTKAASLRKSYDELVQGVRSSQESAAVASRAYSQESLVMMSQQSQLLMNSLPHVEKDNITSKRAASSRLNVGVSSAVVDKGPPAVMRPQSPPPYECIDLVSSPDWSSKKPAAHTSTLSAAEPSLKGSSLSIGVSRKAVASDPAELAIDEDDYSAYDYSPVTLYAKKQAPPERVATGKGCNSEQYPIKPAPLMMDESDDIGSDYSYSPVKPYAQRHEARTAKGNDCNIKQYLAKPAASMMDEDADIGSDYSYSPVMPYAKRMTPAEKTGAASVDKDEKRSPDSKPSAKLKLPDFLNSSDDEDDVLGDVWKKPSRKALSHVSQNRSVASAYDQSSDVCSKTKPTEPSNDALSIASSDDNDEDGYDFPAELGGNNNKSKNTSPEVIDLIDDD
jgi:ERCC4-type nuclease